MMAAAAGSLKVANTVVANGSHQTSIYVLERDSKYIYEYNIAKKLVFRRQVNVQQAFQHNFAYV